MSPIGDVVNCHGKKTDRREDSAVSKSDKPKNHSDPQEMVMTVAPLCPTVGHGGPGGPSPPVVVPVMQVVVVL